MKVMPQFVSLYRNPDEDTYHIIVESFTGAEYMYQEDLTEERAYRLYDRVVDANEISTDYWSCIKPHVKHMLEHVL